MKDVVAEATREKEPAAKERGERKNMPVKHIHAHRMDDGSWTVRAESDNYNAPGPHSYESAHKNAADALSMVHDHMTSPHLPELGNGQRFANLSGSLADKGARNPDALAAFIGRKKFGKAKFQGLAANGK